MYLVILKNAQYSQNYKLVLVRFNLDFHERKTSNYLRDVHTVRLRLRFFIAINGLCGIQCKCSYGKTATPTLNPTQPISCEN